MLKRHLPIAAPCHEDFDAMHDEGAGKRHCESCAKSVHNLSDMTEGQARGLLQTHRGARVCVRYKSNGAGEIMFQRPSVGAPRTGMLAAMTSLMAGVALVALSGCTDGRQPNRVYSEHCEFDLGPWSYELDRGEGNCPAQPEPEVLVGELEAVDTIPCDGPTDGDVPTHVDVVDGNVPTHVDVVDGMDQPEDMGEIAEEPPVELVEPLDEEFVLGQMPVVDPALLLDAPPEHDMEEMGNIAAPPPEDTEADLVESKGEIIPD